MENNETQGLGGHGSLKATTDLSGTISDVTGGNATGTTYKNGSGLFVTHGADGYFAVAGANALALGVLNGTPKLGQAAAIDTVRGLSVSVISGAAFAIGAKLMTDANGAAVVGAGAAQIIVAVALQASLAAGQIVKVMLLDSYVA